MGCRKNWRDNEAQGKTVGVRDGNGCIRFGDGLGESSHWL